MLSQSKRPPGSQKQEGSALPPCLSWHRDLQTPVYLAAAHTVLRVLLHTSAQQESVAFPAQALRICGDASEVFPRAGKFALNY
jgi:hypothetical protein